VTPARRTFGGQDYLGGLFRQMIAAPGPDVAEACRRSTVEALKASSDGTERELGKVLELARMDLSLIADPQQERAVVASIMVDPARLSFARQHAARVERELQVVVLHHGWRLHSVRFVAAARAVKPPPVGPPKRLELAPRSPTRLPSSSPTTSRPSVIG
jgi:hypothetical protein